MKFEDAIEINASPQAAFQFFEHMEENYLDWHKDHLVYKWILGNELKEGNKFYFEEKIGREVLKKKVVLTKIIKNKYIEFQPTNVFLKFFLPKMTFIIENNLTTITFRAQIFLKWFGPLAKKLKAKQFDEIRIHMKEEGENLKQILENQF